MIRFTQGDKRKIAVMLLAFMTLGGCQSAKTESSGVMLSSAGQEALMTKGDVARSLGKDEEARGFYEQAAAQSQGSIRAHLELAGLYRRAGERQKTQDILAKAYALNPDNVTLLKEYAQALLLAGDTAHAARIAAEGLELSPHDVPLLNTKAVAFDRLGDYAKAQALYREALSGKPAALDRETTVNNFALSMVASGQYGQAIRLLESSLPQAQNKPALRQLLALAYGANGQRDKAYELGLQDLTLQQVNENLRFYEQLRNGQVDAKTLLAPAG